MDLNQHYFTVITVTYQILRIDQEDQVTIGYRVSVSWWRGTLYTVDQDVLLSFKADSCIVLSVHDSVDL